MTLDPPREGWESLLASLERARERGYLGGPDIQDHIRHAQGFLPLLQERGARRVLDLGSGAGVPGLMLAVSDPDLAWVLVDSSTKRVELLREAISASALDGRVTARDGRAEELAHDPALRGEFDAVVSRSFGPPAVTAECAAGFLRVGGALIVSEPPDSDGRRWEHRAELARLGFSEAALHGKYCVLELRSLCSDTFPRRVGIPTKRPLFGS